MIRTALKQIKIGVHPSVARADANSVLLNIGFYETAVPPVAVR